MDRVAVEGWVTVDVAKELFTKAGLDFDTAKAEAAKGAYHVDMGDLAATVNVKNTIKNRYLITLLPLFLVVKRQTSILFTLRIGII